MSDDHSKPRVRCNTDGEGLSSPASMRYRLEAVDAIYPGVCLLVLSYILPRGQGINGRDLLGFPLSGQVQFIGLVFIHGLID